MGVRFSFFFTSEFTRTHRTASCPPVVEHGDSEGQVTEHGQPPRLLALSRVDDMSEQGFVAHTVAGDGLDVIPGFRNGGGPEFG